MPRRKREPSKAEILARLERIEELLVSSLRQRLPAFEAVPVKKLMKLVAKVPGFKSDCQEFQCYECDVETRNRCYKSVKRELKKGELIEKMPFTKEALSSMKRSELMMVCGILGINTFKLKDHTLDGLIETILIRQDEVMEKLCE